MPEIEFQVGKTYSNRIGEYKVLEINRSTGRMEVCYTEGGEHKSLDMTIQSRICQNMVLDARRDEIARLEEEASAAKATKTSAKASAKAKAPAKKTATKKAPTKKASTRKTSAKKTKEPATPSA